MDEIGLNLLREWKIEESHRSYDDGSTSIIITYKFRLKIWKEEKKNTFNYTLASTIAIAKSFRWNRSSRKLWCNYSKTDTEHYKQECKL